MRTRRFPLFTSAAIPLLLAATFAYSTTALAFNGPAAGQSAGSGSGAIGVGSNQDISIGTSTASTGTKLLVQASSTNDTSSFVFKVLDSTQNPLFIIRNDGSIGMGTSDLSGGLLNVNGLVSSANGFTGSINAANVTAGTFGNNFGGGAYAFPAAVTFPTYLYDSAAANSGGYWLNSYSEYGYLQNSGSNTWSLGWSNVLNGSQNNVLSWNASGDIGINTTPVGGSQLTIGSAGNTQLSLTSTGAGTNDYAFYLNQFGRVSLYDMAAGKDRFAVSSNGDTWLAPNGGNVGIGTTAPSRLLDLYSSNDNALGLRRTTWNGTDEFVFTTEGNPGSEFLATSWYNGSTDKELFTVASNGNVGIGTVTPTSTLQVNGSANITGNLTVGGTFGGQALTGTLNAANVSAGTFGSNVGGGMYIFPSSVEIEATSTICGGGALCINMPSSPEGVVWENPGFPGVAQIGSQNDSGTADLTLQETQNSNAVLHIMGNGVIYTPGVLQAGTTQSGHSQDFGGTTGWFSTTNNNISALLGYSSGNDAGLLELFNGGTQTVNIGSNQATWFDGGDVGIGTTNPIRPLTIAESGNAGELSFVSASGTASTAYIDVSDVNGSNSGSLDIRGLASSGSTGTNLSEIYLDANTVNVNGALSANTFTGTINAGNVSAGTFGSNVGNGSYEFPASVELGGTNPLGWTLTFASPYDNIGWYGGDGGFINDNDGYRADLSLLGSPMIRLSNNGYQVGGGQTGLFVTNGNLVGIGTSNPGAVLDVNGGARIGAASNLGLVLNSTGNDGASFSTVDDTIQSWNGIGFNSNCCGITGNNYSLVIDTRTGNLYTQGDIGIGTAGPGASLEVSASAPDIWLSPSGYGGNYRTELGAQSNAIGSLILGNNGENEIRFGNSAAGGLGSIYVNNTNGYNADSNGTLSMQFLANGNVYVPNSVGIGTASPDAKLDVISNSSNNEGGTFALGRIPYGSSLGQTWTTFVGEADANGATPGGGAGLVMNNATNGNVSVSIQTQDYNVANYSTTFAANGDVGIGTTAPGTTLDSEGAYDRATLSGNTTNYYGGGAQHTGVFGDQYGDGSPYTYGNQNATSSVYMGGMAGGYFHGGEGYPLAGGGAGIVAIGGNAYTYSGSTAQGGAGIYAQGGINADGSTETYAGYFDGPVYVNGNETVTGTLTGTFNGTVNAANISAGTFGNSTGGGAYEFPSTLTVDGNMTADGTTDIGGNALWAGYTNETWTQPATNAAATLYINYRGYNQGFTQPRSLFVGNGEQSAIAYFDGTTKDVGIDTASPDEALTVDGHVSTNGVTPSLGNQYCSTGNDAISGTDTAGRVTISGTCSEVHIIFSSNFASTPVCTVTDGGTSSNPLVGAPYEVVSLSTAGFYVISNRGTMANGNEFMYMCIGT